MKVLLAGALAALVLAPAAGAWSWPVNGDVLKPFIFDRSHPYAAGQHRGIDIGADTGSPILAPASGTVSFAGTVPTNGKTVTIQTPDGYAVTLVHLGSYSVTKGAAVAEGDSVGTVGPSGVPDETVPYVYLGVRQADDPQGYVDPLTFLPDRNPPPPVSPDGQSDGGVSQPSDVPLVADGSTAPDETSTTAGGADEPNPVDLPGANSLAGGSQASSPDASVDAPPVSDSSVDTGQGTSDQASAVDPSTTDSVAPDSLPGANSLDGGSQAPSPDASADAPPVSDPPVDAAQGTSDQGSEVDLSTTDSVAPDSLPASTEPDPVDSPGANSLAGGSQASSPDASVDAPPVSDSSVDTGQGTSDQASAVDPSTTDSVAPDSLPASTEPDPSSSDQLGSLDSVPSDTVEGQADATSATAGSADESTDTPDAAPIDPEAAGEQEQSTVADGQQSAATDASSDAAPVESAGVVAPESPPTGEAPSASPIATPTVAEPNPPAREDSNGPDPASPGTLAGQIQIDQIGEGGPLDPPGGWHVGYPVPQDPTEPAIAPASVSLGETASAPPPTAAPSVTPAPSPVAAEAKPAAHEPPQFAPHSGRGAPHAAHGRSVVRAEHTTHTHPKTNVNTLSGPTTRTRAAVHGDPRPARTLIGHRAALGGMWPGRAPEVAVRGTAAHATRADAGPEHLLRTLLIALGAALGLALAVGGAAGRRRGAGPVPHTPVGHAREPESGGEEARIMSSPPRLDLEAHLAGPIARTHPRRGRLAIRSRTPAHRSCRGVRPLGRLRPLPPDARKPRAHGLRNRRTRHARHGHRRSGRAIST
jgi:Peptidase family M23